MPEFLNLVCGLPDDGRVRVSQLQPTIEFQWDGTPCFLEYIPQTRTCFPVWLGPASPNEVRLKPGPIVNYIADPDQCGLALGSASRVAGQTDRRWFNHPDRIRANTRDGVSQTLQGIAGVCAPKVIRCRPAGLEDLIQVIAQNGFQYPVLIRAVGSQRGQTLVRVDGEDDVQGLATGLAAGAELYVCQYVEFADADGLHRKYRLAMIGGRAFLNSLVPGADWNLHASSRIWNDATMAEESAALDGFATGLGLRLKPQLDEIYRRIGLDYFGIDFAMRPDGSMLIFEANAVMEILGPDTLEPNIWAENRRSIMAALAEVLERPELWVGAGRPQP